MKSVQSKPLKFADLSSNRHQGMYAKQKSSQEYIFSHNHQENKNHLQKNSNRENNQQNASQSLDILNCFDNLSLVMQDQNKNHTKNIGIYSGSSAIGMSDFQNNKFEPNFCVELKKYQKWSLSNSPQEIYNQQCQRTFVKQRIILQHHQQQNQNVKKQKFQQQKQKSKMAESILQEYSFNVEQSNASSAFNIYLPPKENVKAPFAILIEKLDTLLKRQAQKQKEHLLYNESKPSTLTNSGIVLNSLFNPSKDTSYKNSQLKKNELESQNNSNNFYEISNLNNLHEKLQFYASYVQKLQQQNISLKANFQKLFQQSQLTSIKLNKLQNNLKQKDIIIKYLTEQLTFMNAKTKSENQKSSNKLSSKPIITKRNTVDGQCFANQNGKLQSFGNSYNKANIRRASQYHEYAQKNQKNVLNLSFNKNKENLKQNMKQNMNVKDDSFKKNDRNITTKNITSHRLSFGSFANSSNNKNSKKLSSNIQFQQVPIMLKKENELLITKLNILYEDYQNLINKFNQMCSQKDMQGQSFKRQQNKINFDLQHNSKTTLQSNKINENKNNLKPVIQFGYQKKINQIINQIKNKTNLKLNRGSIKLLHTFSKEQFQTKKTLNSNFNRHFQTEQSRGLFEQRLEQAQPCLIQKKSKNQRTKSQLNNKYPISQPQTQRIFFNNDMKPAIYSYNNSFCEEINDSSLNNNYQQKKTYLQVNFKKSKPDQYQNQKKRSRQAPRSQRSDNSENFFKFAKIQ